jgi:hypothetical protein
MKLVFVDFALLTHIFTFFYCKIRSERFLHLGLNKGENQQKNDYKAIIRYSNATRFGL